MKTFKEHLNMIYSLNEQVVNPPIKFDHNDNEDPDKELFFIHHAPETKDNNQIDAIKSYCDHSTSMNKSLWKKKFDFIEDEKNASLLTDALKTAPAAKEDFHVYTGVNANRNEIKKGDLHIPAFTSASYSPIIAGRFVRPIENRHTEEYHPDEDGNMVKHTVHHILKIHVKKGQQVGAYIADHSFAPHEKEFLINKGHTIHISGDYEDHHNPPEENGYSRTRRIYRIHHATITPDDDK